MKSWEKRYVHCWIKKGINYCTDRNIATGNCTIYKNWRGISWETGWIGKYRKLNSLLIRFLFVLRCDTKKIMIKVGLILHFIFMEKSNKSTKIHDRWNHQSSWTENANTRCNYCELVEGRSGLLRVRWAPIGICAWIFCEK